MKLLFFFFVVFRSIWQEGVFYRNVPYLLEMFWVLNTPAFWFLVMMSPTSVGQLRKLVQWFSTDKEKKKGHSNLPIKMGTAWWKEMRQEHRVALDLLTFHKQDLLVPGLSFCHLWNVYPGSIRARPRIETLVGSDYHRGAMPCLLKRTTSPKSSAFQLVGRAMPAFWDFPTWSISNLWNASKESGDEQLGET